MSVSAVGAMTGLAASRHGVITRSQAADHELSNARLATAVRQGWLEQRHPNVFVIAGAPSTDRQRMLVATSAV
ncbi:MAG: type IV toxin-antitoxin system AbiEi family antitoxin domain-containing protein, partial [Actinomycetota bacterium]